jgi:hypothetical protein
MMRNSLMGAAAGLASALLFASMLSGSALSIALFYTAPLPVMIVGLGWTHRAGLVAAFVGAIVLGIGLNPTFGAFYLLGVALPAWILAYLAMLGRATAAGQVEWYPLGRVVATAALLGGGLGSAAALALGPTYEAFRKAMNGLVVAMLREQTGIAEGEPLKLPDVDDVSGTVGFLASIAPPAVVAFWVLITLFNLWLAGRIVKVSGRLARPWPDLAATRLPRWSALVFGAGVLAAFLPGMARIVGELVSCALAVAFMIAGFMSLHDVTRRSSARPLILSGVYVISLVMSWPLVAIALLGLADTLTELRERMRPQRRPPDRQS